MSDKKKEKQIFINKIKSYIKERVAKEGISNLSSILQDAHEEYVEGIRPFVDKDPEQSWKPFNGHMLEKLILDSIENTLQTMGLKVISGTDLNGRNTLSKELSRVKRNVVVNFGKYGMHLPDVDLIAYRPDSSKVEFIISSKTSIRERIAQTGYWKLKLLQDPNTKHIKVFFVTLDKKGELVIEGNVKKGRAIAEVDTDGTYVITDKAIKESKKVKKFNKFFEDVKRSLK